MFEWIFWLSLFGASFSYFIYPLILLPLRRKAQPSFYPEVGGERPMVTLIIAAYNEEERIVDKLQNSLAIDYPKGKLQIIVASDCSSDKTDTIVRGYAGQGVELVRSPGRDGKEAAQKSAIKHSCGDILVFSDTATGIPSGAITKLVDLFLDPGVGAISSEDRFVSQDGEIVGEGAYVKYEMWLRRQESRVAGLVGLSGSFFAARSEVCQDWSVRVPSDFNTALNCMKHGLYAVSSAEVVGVYSDVKNPAKEYQRKVRTVLRGITALAASIEVLDPRRYGLFSLQVWGHKVMRWAVPWLLMVLLLSSVMLLGECWFYNLAVFGQLVFYGLGVWGWCSASMREWLPIRIIFFFLQVNVAIAQAWIKFCRGQRMTVWNPSQR